MESLHTIFLSFPEALMAGSILAAACAFLGVFVVLKRLVFIGAALSETATCGIAASFFLGFHPFWGALGATFLVITLLALMTDENRIPRDAMLAAFFVFSAALGPVLVSKSPAGLDEIRSLLYGDLAVTSAEDLRVLIWSVLPASAAVLIFFRPIMYTFVDRDEAKVLGLNVRFWELFFFYALGIVVSAASKLGGMLLVFCCLVIPAITGLLVSGRFLEVLLIAVGSSVLCTFLGFWFSFVYDFPANQMIILFSCGVLLLAVLIRRIRSLRR